MDRGALPAETERSPRQNTYVRKTLYRTYAVCIFTMVFCVNAPAPLFELFRRTIGLSPSELSMLYAVYAGIVILALPFFGRASDRFGRRALIALGLGFIAIGSLILTMAGSFLLLVLGRLSQGVGVAAMSAPAAAALAELAGAQRLGSAASTVAVALAIGGAAAPLFSGIAAEALPSAPTAPLLFCSAMALAGLVSVALLPDPRSLRQPHPDPRSLHARQPRKVPPQAHLLGLAAASAAPLNTVSATGATRVDHGWNRLAFWQASAAVVACFGAQATFFTVSGPIFATLLASHVFLTAGCAMSALMIASGLGSVLASRMTTRVAIASGMSLLVPGVCGFFGLVGVVPILMPAVAAIGLAHGLGYAGAIRLINETAPEGCRAGYMSKFYVAIYIGGGLPVLAMGLLEGWLGQAAASAIFSVAIAAIALGLLTSLAVAARTGHER